MLFDSGRGEMLSVRDEKYKCQTYLGWTEDTLPYLYFTVQNSNIIIPILSDTYISFLIVDMYQYKLISIMTVMIMVLIGTKYKSRQLINLILAPLNLGNGLEISVK